MKKLLSDEYHIGQMLGACHFDKCHSFKCHSWCMSFW